MGMNEEAITKLLDTGQSLAKAQLVHETASEKHFLIDGSISVFAKDLRRTPTFNSYAGFTQFLDSSLSNPFCDEGSQDGESQNKDGIKGAVFVDAMIVQAVLDYWEPAQDIATLRLAPSEEYAALQRMVSGVGQKDLWRMLVTDLHGCIDPSLAMAVSRVKVSGKKEIDSQIAVTGATSASGSDVIVVQFTGKDGIQTAEIALEWVWRGRIWDQFSYTSEVTLRFELDTSDGVVFRFHPRRIGDAKRDAQQALVRALSEDLNSERWVVCEGVHG